MRYLASVEFVDCPIEGIWETGIPPKTTTVSFWIGVKHGSQKERFQPPATLLAPSSKVLLRHGLSERRPRARGVAVWPSCARAFGGFPIGRDSHNQGEDGAMSPLVQRMQRELVPRRDRLDERRPVLLRHQNLGLSIEHVTQSRGRVSRTLLIRGREI